MKARSTRSPSPAPSATASTCLGTGTLSPVRADSSISSVAEVRMRASAGTRSPASMLTMSPGTSWSIGSWTREPSRRTLAETTIIFWSAATLAFALPSWFRPIAALSRVRPMSTTPVATWPGRNRLSTPAASSTICIGSRYWRRNACQRGSFGGSANLFGPYLARRASASACVRPCSTVTPCRSSAACGVRACQITVPSEGADGWSVIVSFLPDRQRCGDEGRLSSQEDRDGQDCDGQDREQEEDRPHEAEPGPVRTRAIARPPMTTADVGVTRFTSPFALW